MLRRCALIVLLFAGCAKKSEMDVNLADRNRFLKENRYAVRILKIDDEGSRRRVEVAGIITKEGTWATFNKDQNPKVGEIWAVRTATDGKDAWLWLSYDRPNLED